jgi:putative flippase GtrA
MGSVLSRLPEKTVRKAIRYAVVGALSNLALYGLYLALTMLTPVAPLTAATVVFATGIALTYGGNALWAFERSRSHLSSAARYVTVYLAGYGIQIGVLAALIRLAGAPHQIAQLIAMGAAAVTIFTLLNLWVFAARRPAATRQD